MSNRVDIVIPVFNESAAIKMNIEIILNELETAGLRSTSRIILIDDGSQDDTYASIQSLMADCSNVAAIRLTRNFGKEAAIETGLRHSSADAVIIMDSDLQHPPSLLPQFIEHWKNGALVVEGVKRSRGDEGASSTVFARMFYWLFGWLADIRIDNHSDFKLLDRRVVDLYLKLPERNKFFRGLVPWLGHTSVRLPFDVSPRGSGQSTWSRLALFRYAWNNICSFSSIPLQFVSFLGIAAVGVSLVVLVIAVVQYARGTAVEGFTTVIFLLVFLSGMQMTAIGILGGFVARIYNEVKGRPTSVVAELAGPIESVEATSNRN